MELLSLGHSSYLLEMRPDPGSEPVRILADPWLSDWVIGDLMGRFPRLRFEPRDLGPLHGIFLSHSHTDHLDPYSLVRLWKELDPKPALLLPESLRFLGALLGEHLPGGRLVFLRERQPVPFHGLEVSAFFNPEVRPSNEDDVMVLAVESEREVFVSEADAVLPFYEPELRGWLSEWLCAPRRENVVFLTTRNEIDATLESFAARDLEDRRVRVERSVEKVYDEICDIFSPPDEEGEDEAADLWRDERVVRLIGGQGICFPQDVKSDWNRVLFPVRIADRVRMEREVAEQFECAVSIEELVPGSVHRLESSRLAAREAFPALRLLDREADRVFDPRLALFEDFPQAPLRDDERDRSRVAAKVARVLDERFLPWLIGSRDPPVEHLLGSGGGEYRIRVRHGNVAKHEDRDYRLGFDALRFRETEPSGTPDEVYWASDLDDFLEGRCDEFSTFCRRPLGGRSIRLWRCLGLPYLNDDLIEKKLRLHFERAARGEPLDEWALAFWRR